MERPQDHLKKDFFNEQEEVWVDVIKQIDAAYVELIQTQVDLENSNEELRQARDFLANIQRDMSDLLLVTSAEGTILQVNRFFERYGGHEAADLLGQPLEVCFAPEDHARLRHLLANGRNSHQDLEMDLLVDQGPLRLSVNCSPHFDAEGAYMGLILIGRPIGELQRAYRELERAHQELLQTQEQLIHAEKMASLGRLVAGVAHEINNPFSFVFANLHMLPRYLGDLSGYLNLLEAQVEPQTLSDLKTKIPVEKVLGDLDSLVEGSLEGAERIQDIIGGLKQFSSTQTKQAAPLDLAKLVRTSVGWTKGKANLAIEDLMPEELLINAPPGEVGQVLVNLLQNAMDSMQDCKEPKVQLQAGREKGQIWLSIKDWGTGIAPEHLAQIWEPFFTTKPIGEGTGLGLSISFGLVERLGGSLKAQNHAHGACFTLTLPERGTG